MIVQRHTFLQEQRQPFIVRAMELKDRVKKARKHASLSQVELAEKVGISQASVSEIERGLSRTSSHLLRIALVCKVNPVWLSDGRGEMEMPMSQDHVEQVELQAPQWRNVPIVGTAQLGPEGYWLSLGPGDGYVFVPTNDPEAYAIRLRGDSMAPAIRSGWVAVCGPGSEPAAGEYVHIRLKSEYDDGESMVKEFLYCTDDAVHVSSVNSAYGRKALTWEQIEIIHAVTMLVPPSQVKAY